MSGGAVAAPQVLLYPRQVQLLLVLVYHHCWRICYAAMVTMRQHVYTVGCGMSTRVLQLGASHLILIALLLE
jgi:hypothetical protein